MLPPRIIFYNLVSRHWHNWRIRRMWRADPNRPTICPHAGPISRHALDWAKDAFVAQRKEHRNSTPGVAGSNPAERSTAH